MQRIQKKAVNNAPAQSGMMKFYTDEAPGIKLTPSVVLVMAIAYIGGVIALHILGKLAGSSKAPESA